MKKVREDYLGLITSWHRAKPRFESTIGFSVDPLITLSEFIAHLPQDFDLDEAIGVQLDVVGQWVGRSRYIDSPIPGLYFTFDDPLRGFDRGIWKGPYDSPTEITRLDDDTYRLLLRAKILANNWDGTVESAQDAIDKLFSIEMPDALVFIEDRGDGSMLFGVTGKVPSVLFLSILTRGYIPLKPEGIKTYYAVTSVNETPMFGFDVQNEYVTGFNAGVWGVPPDYIVDHPV